MPEPELNDLLKLLEKKYTKKPEGDAARTSPPAPARPPSPPPAASLPPPPAAAAVPSRPAVAPPPPPPAAAVPPVPRPPSLAPPPPAAAVAPGPRPPSAGPPAPASAPSSPESGEPASTSATVRPVSPPSVAPGAGMITGISVPRRGMTQTPGGRRPPPPTSGFGGGVPSRFSGSSAGTPAAGGLGGAPSAFGGGAPSAFGGGAPSAFGGGAPSAFGAGAPHAAAQAPAAAASPPPREVRVPRSDEPAEAHYGLVVKPIPKPLNTALRQVDNMNIIRAMRPRVGRETSLWMFRAAYFMGLLQSHGRDFHPWSLLAGRKFGQLVQIPDYESIDKAFRQLKIGRVTYYEDPASVSFDVQECLICSGIFGIEEPCCGFVGGLLGSVVQRVTGRDVVVKETQCTATSHDICRFLVTFSRGVVTSD